METKEWVRPLPGVGEPTKAEMAASVLSGEGTNVTAGELVPTTVRAPVWVVAVLDAMATRSGKSRNYVHNLVLAAGLDAVQEHMSEEVRSELALLSADALEQARAESQGMSGEVR